MELGLKGKTVLVTGGSKGIGLACAMGFAAEGCNVHIVSRDRERLETIHDFSGFPAELYRIRYDAPGAPEVAGRALALLREAGYTAAIDGCRGIDHGAWVPLRHMYPERDVPVVQISVQPALGAAHHLRLGEALAPLAAEGVLVIGSGHVTHNLRDWFSSRHDPGALDYVRKFAEWLNVRIAADDRAAVIDYREQAPGG